MEEKNIYNSDNEMVISVGDFVAELSCVFDNIFYTNSLPSALFKMSEMINIISISHHIANIIPGIINQQNIRHNSIKVALAMYPK